MKQFIVTSWKKRPWLTVTETQTSFDNTIYKSTFDGDTKYMKFIKFKVTSQKLKTRWNLPDFLEKSKNNPKGENYLNENYTDKFIRQENPIAEVSSFNSHKRIITLFSRRKINFQEGRSSFKKKESSLFLFMFVFHGLWYCTDDPRKSGEGST